VRPTLPAEHSHSLPPPRSLGPVQPHTLRSTAPHTTDPRCPVCPASLAPRAGLGPSHGRAEGL